MGACLSGWAVWKRVALGADWSDMAASGASGVMCPRCWPKIPNAAARDWHIGSEHGLAPAARTRASVPIRPGCATCDRCTGAWGVSPVLCVAGSIARDLSCGRAARCDVGAARMDAAHVVYVLSGPAPRGRGENRTVQPTRGRECTAARRGADLSCSAARI